MGVGGDPWQLYIPNVHLNVDHPFTAVVTLSPGEKALIDRGILRSEDLISSYRDAIERMDYKTFGFVGIGPS